MEIDSWWQGFEGWIDDGQFVLSNKLNITPPSGLIRIEIAPCNHRARAKWIDGVFNIIYSVCLVFVSMVQPLRLRINKLKVGLLMGDKRVSPPPGWEPRSHPHQTKVMHFCRHVTLGCVLCFVDIALQTQNVNSSFEAYFIRF